MVIGKKTTLRANISEPTRRGTSRSNDGVFAVHLLDVGTEQYGDAILCQFGEVTVLIDGAHAGNSKDEGPDHPSIQKQVGTVLGATSPPYRVSLLIVTHAHADHIGCLPALVKQNLIAADWALVADPKLGWGHVNGADALADLAPAARQLAASLREETQDAMSDADFSEFAEDAVSLETRYNDMLDKLEQDGTKVVRYGVDDTDELLREFAQIGLKIVGPSREQLEACAKLIEGRSKQIADVARSLLPESADASNAADAYRRIVASLEQDAAAADAFSKDKGAINDQSIVTTFTSKGVTLLFTGDMQLSQPEVSDQAIVDEIAKLNATLAQAAPYGLVKLPHHGSYNGFSEDLFEQWGKPLVIGMCTGSESKSHPNPQTLEILQSHTQQIRWVRTDHNGFSSFIFAGSQTDIDVTRGQLNDPVPNSSDVVGQAGAGPPGGTRKVAVSTMPPTGPSGVPSIFGSSPIIFTLPSNATRVTITIDLASGGGSQGGSGPQPSRPPGSGGPPRPNSGGDELKIAGGRPLPPLLIATNKQTLADNIGITETEIVLAALRSDSQLVVRDDVGGNDPAQVAASLRATLQRNRQIRGVVLLGGYDIIPSQIVDTLSASLRQQLGTSDDADDFIVWNDDVYGDIDNDGVAELAVSRIPDGKSSQLIYAALQATPGDKNDPRSGLRSFARPFADNIFGALPGGQKIITSKPTLYSDTYTLRANRVYLMLHGSDQDATRFFGEDGSRYPVAMQVGNVPELGGAVVFTGCCWGALPVTIRARDASPGTAVANRTSENSIALRYLSYGAIAFIGCTGTHYSPLQSPYTYFGGPLHSAFWRNHLSGMAPAQAIFEAKREYLKGIPHLAGQGPALEAIEMKLAREYACLGLGW
jgi:beta-lactamase superfamily II metal-dependent hydrolase